MTLKSAIKRLMLVSGFLLVFEPIQGQDDTRYKVHIPPFMQIDALGADRVTTHPMTGASLTFSNQLWYARTSSGTGSTVRLSSDHAFHNLSDSSYKRDVRLQLTQMAVTQGSGWKFDTVVDTTNYATSDETATVQVSCTRPGNAIIWMNVTFMTGNLATLKGGQYQMTVVGTISEN